MARRAASVFACPAPEVRARVHARDLRFEEFLDREPSDSGPLLGAVIEARGDVLLDHQACEEMRLAEPRPLAPPLYRAGCNNGANLRGVLIP